MDRRDFLKSSGLLMAGTAAASVVKEDPARSAGRQVLPINRGWRYSTTATPEMHRPEHNDASWTVVSLPHTNIELPWHGFDDHAYEFISVYRRPFNVPAGTVSSGKRVFVDFEGVMTAADVWINGTRLGSYRGGYTPFSFEVTGHVADGKNLLSVQVDSRERSDIPPFGYEIDYLTFGGIYREVQLRVVPEVFLENIRATPKDVLSGKPTLSVDVYLDRGMAAPPASLSVEVELREGNTLIATATAPVRMAGPKKTHPADANQAMGAQPFDPFADAPDATATLRLDSKVKLWDLNSPSLYEVVVRLKAGRRVIDQDGCRVGFREAMFTPKGFSLNGKIVKLHGLDRHQTFPWVGQAMPASVQRQDAKILRKDLQCNIVRTSHYPQSRHFLDACDEMGLLVLEEIPGWQHIGDVAWQDVAVDNVRRMVRRDWNHPSIVLWGVRINESHDSHDFYTRTNALSHALDASRQTGGIRASYNSELLEDVMTYNDFGWPLQKPNHPLYLNTEFVGHTFPAKTIDSCERLYEHMLRHARTHDQLASDPQYAGGIGWCAFDYNTHANFGSGDHICYHGVMDIFRTPKPAAFFYKSMCSRDEEIVMEPAFHWARNDQSRILTKAMICSNVEHIKLFTENDHGEWFVGEGGPDRVQFPHLLNAPFVLDLPGSALDFRRWGTLRIEGYVGGKLVATRRMAGDGIDHEFVLRPDGTELVADGADAVRVVLRANDRFGNVRPFAADAISFVMEGDATLIGDNPFGLIGGTGAVWLKAGSTAGLVKLHAKHPRLGTTTAVFTLHASPAEIA